MDKHCFLDGGVPPNSRFNPTQMMPNWQSLTLEEPSCSPEKPHGFFRYPMDQHASYESALSSMVSSSPASNDNFAIRELIGKLGSNSAEIAQLPHPLMAGYMGGGSSSGGVNTSSYSNSPPNPKLHFPIMDHFVKDNLANLGNSPPPPLSADPGFAERAAKFSCFGSRSFNGRTGQLGLNSTELPYRSNNPLLGNVKLPRVSSSPSLEAARSPMGARENQNSTQTHMEIRSTTVSETRFATSNDGSSVSGQTPNAGGMRISGDSNPRKRKGKSSVNSTKVQETGDDDDPNNKRAKSIEGNGNENDSSGTEGKGGQKQGKAKSKPSEPPKDYIHVRARRGQATDSHSLAERVRREKISERMKFLQDLVPGCNKVTGKALMLDEIINYVKSLQHRVEHLSMKLASVDPRDISIDSLLSKHAFDQTNGSSCMPLQMSPMETDFFGHHEIPQQLHTKGSMDPMDCRSSGGIMQLPSVDDFGQSLAEFPGLCEGELESIVQMGFGHNNASTNQTCHMKIEL